MFLRSLRVFSVVLTLLFFAGLSVVSNAADRLAEKDLTALVELQIDEKAIVTRIQNVGLSFLADDSVLARLKSAGASEAVLQAVKASAIPAKNAPSVAAIAYSDVLKLVTLGLDEAAILTRLQKSPTVFVLDAGQVAELKQVGASDKLLAAMMGNRPAPPTAADITDFAIILDCSGSMKELTPEGETKMVAAKRVVTDLVRNIPNGMNLTFVIYGHEVFGNADEPRNCQAVKVVRPLSPLDDNAKSELAAFIAGLQPTGATPIALSLRTAGDELAKKNSLCGLVLITDGVETCDGNPAAETAALMAKLKLTFGVHVVGFGLKPEENAAVAEIAKAAGDKGKYYPAKNAAELTQIVKKLHTELKEVAVASPSPPVVVVKAGNFFDDAPLVEAGEQKGDLKYEHADYYKISVRKGQELRAILNLERKTFGRNNFVIYSQNFSIAIYDPQLRRVAHQVVEAKAGIEELVSVRLVWPADLDGTYFVEVSDAAMWNDKVQVQLKDPVTSPYGLLLRVEGAAAGAGLAQATALRQVFPGTNFQTASEINGDGFVVNDVPFGEIRYYAVPIQKGETLEVAAAVLLPRDAQDVSGFGYKGHYFYNLMIHDDDQVQVIKQELDVAGNPSNANPITAKWVAELSGKAYVVLHSVKPADHPEVPPGKFAIHVTKSAPGAFSDAKAGAD